MIAALGWMGFNDAGASPIASSLDNSTLTFILPASGSVTEFLTGEINGIPAETMLTANITNPTDGKGNTLIFDYAGLNATAVKEDYSGNLLSFVLSASTVPGLYSGGSLAMFDVRLSTGGGAIPAVSNSGNPTFTVMIEAAPEPAAWALLLGGLSLAAIWRLRARRI